jgi:hypothetical protein
VAPLIFRLLCLAEPTAAWAQEAPNAGDSAAVGNRELSLPFGFWNKSFGLAAGYVYAVNAYPQPQASLLGGVMGGTEGSAMAVFMGRDIRVLGMERLFVDPIVSVGYFSNFDAYINGNPDFSGQRAGANDSSKDNFVEGNGWDNYLRLRFKYLLPIGNGRDQIIPFYHLEDGLLADGATGAQSFNPWTSGRTFLEVRPFYRAQNVSGEQVNADIATNGVDVIAFWDNRDYPASPSRGNSLSLQVSRDFGAFGSSGSWTNTSAEYDQYLSLGATPMFRQRVIALDVWTSDSPTWKQNPDGSISNGPPQYAGATLGGLFRMRAFPTQRFSDKAAIYGSAEVRLIPEWNPFNGFPRLQERLGVRWIQFAGFVEAGRVAPDWSFTELHRDLKWDAGLGVRLWAKGLVVRVDSAYCNEGFGVQMMVSQPFQF